MICTICLMFTGTYLYDLQFQVDLMRNIYISMAAEKDIEV